MTAVRKSAVSPKGNWFRRNSTPSVEKRRSLGLSESTLADQPPPVVPAIKKRRSSLPTKPISSVKESVIAAQVKPQSGFLNVPVVPNSGAAPFWLLRLYTSHRYSSIVAFLLVSATLVVYGLTVYSQDSWGQGYRKLQNFQLYERQLTTTNASLKNQMAEEAEKQTSGLVSPTPARTLFLPTSPPSASSLPTPDTMPNLATPQQTSSPLGY
ncbi:hypothetical protein [Nostoc sp. CCY0012]|uniref:hypothetical protein n=1 Tax=Nostoc sp. CCY0012 TaxID=1056123 RepID=UPI0039C615F6